MPLVGLPLPHLRASLSWSMDNVQQGRCEVTDPKSGDRIAGAALAAAALVSVVAMAHHPTSAHGGGGLNGLVHGVMIVLVALLAYGFAHFARGRGLDRPAILAGLVAYGVSVFAHVGAATINGFVVPSLAARGGVSHDIFLFAWETNQALAGLGVYATGAAFILWSIDLIRREGGWLRLIGLAGLVAGALPAALLAGGAIRLNVSGAMLVYAVHAAWAALVGISLMRGARDAAADQ
jgi:hypothetical protein